MYNRPIMARQIEKLSGAENCFWIRQWAKANSIERIFLDLDDTITPTGEIFIAKMNTCYDFLTTYIPGYPRDQIRSELETINNQAFETHAVNPRRWHQVVAEFARRHPEVNEKAQEYCLAKLGEIYTTPPRWADGAEETLTILRGTTIPLAIITHANEIWTWSKYSYLSLDRFLQKTDVYIVDENIHKTAEEWLVAANHYAIRPSRLAVIGDSIRSDIQPAAAIGVRHKFWIKNDRRWVVHELETPPETIELPGINDLIPTIIALAA